MAVQTHHLYPYGSHTPAGSPRVWRVTEYEYWGEGVPRLAARGWHEPNPITHIHTDVSEFHTERHALNVLKGPVREYNRLLVCIQRERDASRYRTGEIFMHRAPVSLYQSVDQSVAVGGSRSGLEPEWFRKTLVTRTRDGVAFTWDVLVERVSPPV